jgi:hypothetical protein
MIQKDIDLLHSKKLKGVNNSGLMMIFYLILSRTKNIQF